MINRLTKTIGTILALVCTLFTAPSLAQLSSGERDAVRAEIAAALENYHQVFSTGTPSEIARQIYGAPLVSISIDGGTTVWDTEADVEQWLAGFLSTLKNQGWHHSNMPSPAICVLGQDSGFASGQFVRYREDGSEISRSGMAYVFQRKPAGWRMTSFLAHEADVRLGC